MEQLGKYRILKRLGGGFGDVFLGLDPAMDRQIATKVFRPRDGNLAAFPTSADEKGLGFLRAPFLNEAKIFASVQEEPNIVEV